MYLTKDCEVQGFTLACWERESEGVIFSSGGGYIICMQNGCRPFNFLELMVVSIYYMIIMIMVLTMMMTIPVPFTNHDDNDDMMMTMVIIVDPCTPHPPPANRPGRPTKQHCAGSHHQE